MKGPINILVNIPLGLLTVLLCKEPKVLKTQG